MTSGAARRKIHMARRQRNPSPLLRPAASACMRQHD